MKLLIALPLALFVLSPCIAVSGEASEQAFLAKWLEQQRSVKALSVAFTHTRTLPALKSPQERPGRLWLLAPASFRMELGSPVETIIVGTPAGISVLDVKRRRASLLKADEGGGDDSGGKWRERLGVMRFPIAQNYEELQAQFDVEELAIGEPTTTLKLAPKSPEMRRAVRHLQFRIVTATGFVESFEAVFRNGGSIANVFSTPDRSPDIPQTLFDVDLEGYKVEEE